MKNINFIKLNNNLIIILYINLNQVIKCIYNLKRINRVILNLVQIILQLKIKQYKKIISCKMQLPLRQIFQKKNPLLI